MNPFKKYLLLPLVSMVLILSDRVVCSQQMEWKLVPPINDSATELGRETAMDFENFELLTEILNAVNLLEEMSPGEFSDEELAKLHAINLELNDPLFLLASARQEGVELDLDVIFAMRTSKAKELLATTSEVLGDKMQAVIHVVNRRRMGEWSGAIPTIPGKRMGELLDLDRKQQETLAKLADRYEAEKKDASKALADDLRKLRDEYRKKMTRTLDVEGRRWFDSTFGEPIDLLDENGRSIFVELVEKYDFGPTHDLLENVRPFVASPVGAQHSDNYRDAHTEQGDATENLAIEAIEYALIRSDLIRQEIGLSDSQWKTIREAFAGKNVELTNVTRDSRLKRLIARHVVNRSEFLNTLSAEQVIRLYQIEIQVRTSGNMDSFGLLDDLVALHLRLDAEVRRKIGQLAEEYTAAVAKLLEKHRVESQRLLRDYQQNAFDVLTEAQKRDFTSFFGAFDR